MTYAYNRRINVFQTINRYPHHLLLLYTSFYVVVVMMMTTGYMYTNYIYIYLLIFICIYKIITCNQTYYSYYYS